MQPDKVRTIESTNTQTRYLLILSHILIKIGKTSIPLPLLKRKMLLWSNEQEIQYTAYRNHSGLLTSGGRETKAFPYYIDLLESLGLITKINELVRCSRMGHLFLFIYKEKPRASIQLMDWEKYFYLWLLFSKDADLTIPLISMATLPVNENHIRKNLDTQLAARFKQKALKSNGRTTEDASAMWREWTSRQKLNHKQAHKHLVPPRIAWLIDLDIFQKEQNLIQLTSKGAFFFNKLNYISDTNVKDINENWLEQESFKAFSTLVHRQKLETKSSDINYPDLLGQKLFKLYHEFGTDSAFRLPLDMSYIYLSITTLIEKKIVLEFDDLDKIINEGIAFDNMTFLSKRSVRRNESYINISLN